MTDIRYLYVTAKNFEEARKIAEQVLKERLAACANIIPSMESMYWWQGQIAYTSEAIAIFKTTENLVEQATQTIKHWHSYSTPCIVVLPVEGGEKAYLDWIRGEVKR